MTSPDTTNDAALMYSAGVTGLSGQPNDECAPLLSSARSMNSSPAGSAEPYVVAIEMLFAASSFSRGTRLGTVASFAGSHTRLIASMTTVATSTQASAPTMGIVTNTAPRSTSPTMSVHRRSSRSAMYPASGPSTIAGSTRKNSTAAIAKLWSAYEV